MEMPIINPMEMPNLNSHSAHLRDCRIRTCWIAAENALQHIRRNINQIDKVLARWQLSDSDYAVCAGFDESAIRSSLDLQREDIHVFIFSERFRRPPKKLLDKLGKIFCPFDSILFMNSTAYRIPDFRNGEIMWSLDDFFCLPASMFVETVTNFSMEPAAASCVNTEPNESGGIQCQKSGKPHGAEGATYTGAKCKKEVENEGQGHGTDKGPCLRSNLPLEGASDAGQSVPINFHVISNIHSQDCESSFQTITTEGSFSFEVSFAGIAKYYMIGYEETFFSSGGPDTPQICQMSR